MNETDQCEDDDEGGWTLELVPRPPLKQVETSSDSEQQHASEQKTENALNE